MATQPKSSLWPLDVLQKHRGMLFPLGAAALILVILIPLPTWLLDILLICNIACSALVLMTVMYLTNPLQLSVFPSLLLGLTLFRLTLNTATTRLILTNAQEGTAAAGRVVQTFGEFVAAGSLAVGVIIFIIIAVIQFVVITKGATRIAEVAARFTLDGMPGKQMAIDADLNAGLINEDEAKARRAEVSAEADFYGAMDGASKFVRGDAIAGIFITFVNILGGLYVGLVEHNFGLWDCLQVYTRLSIGDGLTSQIPAFIVSISAGILVTRSTAKEDLGEELISQLTRHPIALGLSAGFLGMLALTPMPKVPILLAGGGLTGMAFVVQRAKRSKAVERTRLEAQAASKIEPVESFLKVDPMELEVGYGLIRLVDRKQGGDLLERISLIRRQMAIDLGIIVPPIRIRDNMQLQPNQYAIKIKGNAVATGEVMPGYMLAIDSGAASGAIQGIESREPAFGLPAWWVTPDDKPAAEARNYTVVEASSVLGTHLTELIRRHADELLSRQETNRLFDNLRQRNPKLVEEVVGELLKPGEVQKVLHGLLRERVPIRDLETILETLGDWATRTKDTDVLVEYARNALARSICSQHTADDGMLYCITLDPKLEDLINNHLERSESGAFLALQPAVQSRIVEKVQEQLKQAQAQHPARQPVVICSAPIRAWVRRLIEAALPHLAVLSYNEVVSSAQVKSIGMVALDDHADV